eukprot:Amastigsp_a185219_6.p2 type:complete len:162 gc:universal Amastigsp_a185219_6:657-1142(+)
MRVGKVRVAALLGAVLVDAALAAAHGRRQLGREQLVCVGQGLDLATDESPHGVLERPQHAKTPRARQDLSAVLDVLHARDLRLVEQNHRVAFGVDFRKEPFAAVRIDVPHLDVHVGSERPVVVPHKLLRGGADVFVHGCFAILSNENSTQIVVECFGSFGV